MKRKAKRKPTNEHRKVSPAQTAEKVRKRIGYTGDEIRTRIRKYDLRSILD